MSSLMNKLTGKHNKAHTVEQHEHGKPYGTTNANQQQTTTTTTQTTTNNNKLPNNNTLNNQSIHQATYNQQPTLGSMAYNSASTAVGTNPVDSSTTTSTQPTGAAYTNAAIANRGTVNNQQTANQQTVNQGDDAITRSEEQLRLAKNSIESGTASLNKYVSVEHVERQIPITRERLVIERFPINQTNIGQFSSTAMIGEQHSETILYEDRLAAMKEVLPIERIRLAKEVESRVEHVGMDLRKEHVDYEYQPLAPGAKNDDGLAHDAQARHDFSYDTHRKTDSTYGQQPTNYDPSHAKTCSSLTDSSLPGSHGKNSGMHGSGTNPLTDKIDTIGTSGLHHTSGAGLMGQNPLSGGTAHA